MENRGKDETSARHEPPPASSIILHEAARSTGGTILDRRYGMDDMLVQCWKNGVVVCDIVMTGGTGGCQRVV